MEVKIFLSCQISNWSNFSNRSNSDNSQSQKIDRIANGIKNVVKDFALILNPDVILEKNTIDEIIGASRSLDSFGVIAPISDKPKYPNYKLDKTNIYHVLLISFHVSF